jgi:soluble lytic murein transglycosylase-like protein
MKWCATFVLALVLLQGPAVVADRATVSPEQLESLIDAIAIVESNGDPDAVGDGGRALGMYQIHRAYWQDGTRFLGVKWAYEQARDPQKARRVVRAYLMHYGRGKGLLDMARIHNGGPRGHRKAATRAYARKIAQVLQEIAANS